MMNEERIKKIINQIKELEELMPTLSYEEEPEKDKILIMAQEMREKMNKEVWYSIMQKNWHKIAKWMTPVTQAEDRKSYHYPATGEGYQAYNNWRDECLEEYNREIEANPSLGIPKAEHLAIQDIYIWNNVCWYKYYHLSGAIIPCVRYGAGQHYTPTYAPDRERENELAIPREIQEKRQLFFKKILDKIYEQFSSDSVISIIFLDEYLGVNCHKLIGIDPDAVKPEDIATGALVNFKPIGIIRDIWKNLYPHQVIHSSFRMSPNDSSAVYFTTHSENKERAAHIISPDPAKDLSLLKGRRISEIHTMHNEQITGDDNNLNIGGVRLDLLADPAKEISPWDKSKVIVGVSLWNLKALDGTLYELKPASAYFRFVGTIGRPLTGCELSHDPMLGIYELGLRTGVRAGREFSKEEDRIAMEEIRQKHPEAPIENIRGWLPIERLTDEEGIINYFFCFDKKPIIIWHTIDKPEVKNE